MRNTRIHWLRNVRPFKDRYAMVRVKDEYVYSVVIMQVAANNLFAVLKSTYHEPKRKALVITNISTMALDELQYKVIKEVGDLGRHFDDALIKVYRGKHYPIHRSYLRPLVSK